LQHQQQQQAAFSAPNTPNQVDLKKFFLFQIKNIFLKAQQQQQQCLQKLFETDGQNSPSGEAISGGGEEVKPRSLRFTWSMKTTSSLAPDEIIKSEKKILLIKKKNFFQRNPQSFGQ